MSDSFKMWLVIVVYMGLTILVGYITSRKSKSGDIDDYFVSKHSLPPIAVAFSIVATCMSGGMFIGMPGWGYTQGWSILICVCFCGGMIGVILGNLVLGKPMRRFSDKHSATTIVDMLTTIYQDRKITYILVPVTIFGSIFFGMINWVAIGELLCGLYDMSYESAVLIGVVVTLLYSIFGGNSSTAMVSVVQMFIAIAASVLIAVIGVDISGGFTEMNERIAAVDPQMVWVYNDEVPFWTFISFCLMYGLGHMGQPHAAIKYVQIKDPKLYPKALFLGIICFIAVSIVMFSSYAYVGQEAIGNAPHLERPDTLVPTFIALFSNPYVGGLIVAASLSCIMSTGVALMLTGSSSIVKDLMQDIMHINCSGKRGVVYGQIMMIVCTVLSTLMALFPFGDIMTMAAEGWGIFAATFTPAVVLGLRWRRSTRQGAFWGMLVGLAVEVGPLVGLWEHPVPLSPSVTGLFLNTVVFVVISLSLPPQPKDFMPPSRAEMKIAMRAAKSRAEAA